MLSGILALAGVATLVGPAGADPFESNPLVTLQGEAALRDRLGRRILLVTVTPRPLPFQDPGFLPRRFGLGVRTFRDGKPVVLTSMSLVEEAGSIELLRPASRRSAPGRVVRRLEKEGLAILECQTRPGGVVESGNRDGPCTSTPVPLGVRAEESARILYFVLPADGDRLVVSSTRVKGPADPELEGLVVVEGRIPPGTPLFDQAGGVVALVIRYASDGSFRALATVLVASEGGSGESKGK